MLKRPIYVFFLLFAGGLMIASISGCAMFKGPEYSEIIYNHRQPLISVTYEYGEIEIHLPLKYPGARPNNIKFQVSSRGDTSRTMISVFQEASDQFIVYLPQGVLDTDSESNLIKIFPQDPDFIPINVYFKGIQFGKVTLEPAAIVMIPIAVDGLVYLNKNESSLAGVEVSLQSYDNVITKSKTDSTGYFTLTIPGKYKHAKYVQLVAGTNMIFKPFKRKLDFSQSYNLTVNVGLGPSMSLDDPLYLTNKSNVHFRDKPDIGSKTLFLLENGEIISVQRVTPGEYYGSIEVDVGKGKNVLLEGWVYRNDLDLLQFDDLFKKDVKDATSL